MNLRKRIKNFIRYRLIPPHNMLTHAAEQFYYQEYAEIILPYFQEGKSLLDIGCQHGRFTIPAVRSGMIVTATDINPKFFRSIRKHTGNHSVQFRHESLQESVERLSESSFDIVLCLELLYNLQDTSENIRKLSRLVNPGGVLITSHRTYGYYIYRFIREKNFDAVGQIIHGNHPDYNAQNKAELMNFYASAGLDVKNITPVGMFSGFGSDAFSGIANPSKMTEGHKNKLKSLERDKLLQGMLGESARYWLICGMKQNFSTAN